MRNMKNMKKIGAVILSLGLLAGSVGVVPVYADGNKVVTLGADLSDDQKQTMLNYFKVNASDVQILYITNQDERDHLSSRVPVEQIGTRTVSCAYIKPTTSGGIKVRTANLNWVTGNMLASSLSTSGVKNCEVIAACPFEVSGTGALTGVQMAYEQATGETLDPVKTDIAVQEVLVTGNLSNDLGRVDAVNLINDSKIDIIQNQITENTEVTNVVVNVANENNISLSQEQLDEVVNLLQQIADQQYDYEDVSETLENIEESLNDSEIPTEEELDQIEVEEESDSILDEVDESVLGEDVAVSSTEDQSLEEETYTDVPTVEIDILDEGDEWETFEDDDAVSTDTADEGDDSVDTTDGEDTSTEIVEDWTEDTGDSTIPEGDYDTTEEETLLSNLSEQSKSQYEKLKSFVQGEYGGDQTLLEDAMGTDFTASLVLSDFLTEEEIANLENAVSKKYLEILTDGGMSYVADGTESYMSQELCAMDQYLKQLFEVDGTTEESEVLSVLTTEQKELLYKDTLNFFERLYGEEFADQWAERSYTEDAQEEDSEWSNDSYEEDSYTEDTSEEWETYDESYEESYE